MFSELSVAFIWLKLITYLRYFINFFLGLHEHSPTSRTNSLASRNKHIQQHNQMSLQTSAHSPHQTVDQNQHRMSTIQRISPNSNIHGGNTALNEGVTQEEFQQYVDQSYLQQLSQGMNIRFCHCLLQYQMSTSELKWCYSKMELLWCTTEVIFIFKFDF